MILADQIRHFVFEKYISPARERGQNVIRLTAGDIHADMGLQNRFPAVCGALDAEKFAEQYHVIITSRHGPKFGSSTEWEIEI